MKQLQLFRVMRCHQATHLADASDCRWTRACCMQIVWRIFTGTLAGKRRLRSYLQWCVPAGG